MVVNNVYYCEKLAVVDAMVVVQKLTKKPFTMPTVIDLSKCLNDKMMTLSQHLNEIIVVFYIYRTDSLKNTTNQKRRHGKDPVQYQVRNDSNMAHITMKTFLFMSKQRQF